MVLSVGFFKIPNRCSSNFKSSYRLLYNIYIFVGILCVSFDSLLYLLYTRLLFNRRLRLSSSNFSHLTHVFRTNIFNLHRQIATVPLSANFESQSYYAEWCTVKKNDAIASSSNRQSQKQHLVILLCNYC